MNTNAEHFLNTHFPKKVVVTCLGLNCPERKSLCCGAGCTNYIDKKGLLVEGEFVCSKCKKPWVGGECSAV